MSRGKMSVVVVVGVLCVLFGAVLYFQPAVEDGGDGHAPGEGRSPDSVAGQALPALGPAPDFTLIDQRGEEFSRSNLEGKVWLANFIFTRCTQTCPAQTANLVKFKSELEEDPAWAGIRFVSFSVDPTNDTPQALSKYAEQYEALDDHWTFLTGDRARIWEICGKGFHLPVAEDPKNVEMPISHDAKIVLVDRSGRIRGYYNGLNGGDFGRLKQDLGLVLPEIRPPQGAEFDASVTHVAQPPTLVDVEWLQARRDAQLASAAEFDVFHDFRFSDRLAESGITFLPQIVDEQRWRMQVNHYDHGNGVCVADVDGDGRHDLYFLAQAGRNELWRNTGDGTFEDMTARAGVGVDDRISVTASFADVDNDGDADLFVTTVRGGNILFLNDGAGRFQDVTDAAGLTYSGHSSGAVFFDYDHDGLLDLFVCNVGKYTTEELASVRVDGVTSLEHENYKYYVGTKDAFAGHLKEDRLERSIMYRNLGGARFEDVTEQVGLADDSWTGDATPLDVNGDGWQDLYVLNMQGTDEYFENVEGRKFVRKSKDVFPRTPWGSMGVKVFDYNNDGAMDVFVTDMHSDMSEDVGPERETLKSRMQWPASFLASEGGAVFGNAFFEGNGEGGFREISDAIGVENYWPWGFSTGDLNADGFEDLFIASSMCFPYRYGVNSVLLNEKGKKFLPSEFVLGIEPRPDGRVIKPWFELDCSGGDAEHPICEGRAGKIVVWSALGTRSSVLFDIDDDGDLDIVTNDFNSEPMVLTSNLAGQHKGLNYLKVRLQGTRSNRDALGARVTVVCGEGRFVKTNDGKSGYLSQSLLPLYFGLGAAGAVDRVEVAWPTGERQVFSGPFEANSLIELVEK